MSIRPWKKQLLAVSTIVEPGERTTVDAAGAGVYQAWHRESPGQVRSDICMHKAQAILLSIGCCQSESWRELSRIIRETPQIPAIALMKGSTPRMARALLELGRGGVNDVVDISNADGWIQLRRLLAERCTDMVEVELLARIESAGAGMTHECLTFFRTLVKASRGVSSVRRLSLEFDVLPSTLMSRFFRVGLPAPKRYLAFARLVRAAYLFENPGFSIANVANHLEFSSPQSFGRHIRAVMGTTALSFRREFRGQDMVERLLAELVVPYRHILREFNPLTLQANGKPSVS
jgi:AraC-like DNA-binding protein